MLCLSFAIGRTGGDYSRIMGRDPTTLGGRLKIVSLSPRLLTSGTIHTTYMDLIERHRPRRMVLDGASTLERHYSREDFLEILRSMVHANKSRRITTVITSLHGFMRGMKRQELVRSWIR